MIIIWDFLSDEINNKIISYNNRSITANQKYFSLYIHIVPKSISTYNHDKYYVGITSRPVTQRWKNGLGYSTQMFYHAIQKYGWENIKHIVLSSTLLQKEAEDLEIQIIDFLYSNHKDYGYNIAPGGLSGGSPGKKIAQYNLDGSYIQSFTSIIEAVRKYNSNEGSGIQWALSANGRSWHGFMWCYFDDEPLKQIEPYIEYDCRVPIMQYDIYGNFIKEWDSLKDASKYYHTYMISNACRKKAPTAVGYQWKYKSDDSKIIDISDNVRKRIVYVYDIDGNYIGKFDSITNAAKQLNINVKRKGIDISSCYDDIHRNYSHGYRWCNKYYDHLPPLYATTSSKIVVQFDGNSNKIIDIFPKIKSATEYTSESYSTISKSCNNGTITKRNFYWKYLDDVQDPKFINDEIKNKYLSYVS